MDLQNFKTLTMREKLEIWKQQKLQQKVNVNNSLHFQQQNQTPNSFNLNNKTLQTIPKQPLQKQNINRTEIPNCNYHFNSKSQINRLNNSEKENYQTQSFESSLHQETPSMTLDQLSNNFVSMLEQQSNQQLNQQLNQLEQLNNLHLLVKQQILNLFSIEQQESTISIQSTFPNYRPHLSLYYGLNEINKNQALQIINNQLLNHLPIQFNATNLALYLIDSYDTEKWIPLGRVTLGTSRFYRSCNFINGEWILPTRNLDFTNPEDPCWLPVIDPATRQIIHLLPASTSTDIDLAVASAKKAFEQSTLTGKERAKYLRAIAEEILLNKDDMAEIEVVDNGKPIREALMDIEDSAACFEYYAKIAEQLDEKQTEIINIPSDKFCCVIRKEPIGVAGLIIPWNYPLLMAAWKVAPCLAAGCTCVLKPSEFTSLNSLELAAICSRVNIPPGFLNVVIGTGPETGAPLSQHLDIDKIAFTGSVVTGSKVMQACASNITRVSLELGGKSPIIIFDDTDLDIACEWIMVGIFLNQGQVCSATSRALIHENIYDKLIDKLALEVKKIKIGHGLSPDTIMGPIVSESQYNKVLDYIEKGKKSGANLICGGKPAQLSLNGYFIEPTIFTNVDVNSVIWKEEIFGPVLSINKFSSEEEAINIANRSTYGLASAILSRDNDKLERISKKLKTGVVWLNCSQPSFIEAPWGGMKRSGIGRELGPWGLENFIEIKQITKAKDNYTWGLYLNN
eukprot:TRINITY_DN606_c0_g1_i1.p1 TRINITY_DN606_c0_g1~~TRINITY_DN606_c0_g1_i1.p1  ORF type:complete len:738 (-),score=319.19 TRINITY_DN606_c0_g1_i1:21-2234(-)